MILRVCNNHAILGETKKCSKRSLKTTTSPQHDQGTMSGHKCRFIINRTQHDQGVIHDQRNHADRFIPQFTNKFFK